MKSRTVYILNIVLMFLLVGSLWYTSAQSRQVVIMPGESIEVVCQSSTVVPTSTGTPTVIPTSTNTPTNTPIATNTPTAIPTVIPTSTPNPSRPGCGLFYVNASDAPVVQQIGSTLAHLIVRSGQGVASWRQQVNTLSATGAQVILEMYPRPWSWNGSQWTFNSIAQSFLDLASELHSSGQVLAVFGPVDEPYAHNYTTAQLQSLYTALKSRAPDLPVYSTFGSLHFWEDRGDASRTIAHGVVDYASPHYYPFDASGYRRDTYISELEAEIDILNRLAPNTELIWLAQAFALPSQPRGLRMPNGDELRDASQIAFDHNVSILYYTYNRVASSYTDWLAQHPELLDDVCR